MPAETDFKTATEATEKKLAASQVSPGKSLEEKTSARIPKTQSAPSSAIVLELKRSTNDLVLSANEPDDSDNRFKLDPAFDPEPSAEPILPAENLFESNFDLGSLEINTATLNSPETEPSTAFASGCASAPRFAKSNGNFKTAATLAATFGFILVVGGLIAWALSVPSGR